MDSKKTQFFPVTHVIFDMDGLLLDTEIRYSEGCSNLCSRYNSTFTPEAKRAAMGRTAQAAAEVIVDLCSLPITPEIFMKEINEEYDRVFQNVDYMPGAKELVQHFHRHKIPQAIATSSKTSSFRMKTSGKDDIFGLFEHILLATDDPEVKHGKPAPDSFLIAAHRFKVKPDYMNSVLVFEDSPLGAQAGLAAGMQVVYVPDSRFVDIDKCKQEQQATMTIPSLSEFNPMDFQLPPL